MLIIKPIQEKEVQAALCAACRIEDDPSCLAYFAADGNAETMEINSFLGICLFTMDGVFHRLASLPGVSDDEALMIMARTAMNFLYRFDVKEASLLPDCCPTALADRLGFRADETGRRAIDLARFYQSPCHYGDHSEENL